MRPLLPHRHRFNPMRFALACQAHAIRGGGAHSQSHTGATA